MSWRRASIQSWFESPGSESLWRRSARKYARRRIWSSVGSTADREADDGGRLAADFFVAAGFFFLAAAAAARGFFFGLTAVTLPLLEDAAASAAGLFSTAVF